MLSRSARLLHCVLSIAVLSLAPSAMAQTSDARGSLRLRPGDAILLELKDEPELTRVYTVGEDGAVLLPLVGLIRVAGRPIEEARAEILAKYRVELRDPVIRVTPLIRIAVLGEVQRPGLFPVDPSHTIGDLLALAGGLGPEADRGKVTIVRGAESIEVRLDGDFAGFQLALESGDQILVGRQSWLRQNATIFVGALASVAAAALTALIVR